MVKNALKKIFCWGRNVQLLKVGRHCHKDVKIEIFKIQKMPWWRFFLRVENFQLWKKIDFHQRWIFKHSNQKDFLNFTISLLCLSEPQVVKSQIFPKNQTRTLLLQKNFKFLYTNQPKDSKPPKAQLIFNFKNTSNNTFREKRKIS